MWGSPLIHRLEWTSNATPRWWTGHHFPLGPGVWVRDGDVTKISIHDGSHYFEGAVTILLYLNVRLEQTEWWCVGEYLKLSLKKNPQSLIYGIFQFPWCKYFRHG